MPSNVIDFDSVTANMYGCEPCPKCTSEYRVVYSKTADHISCDDCGFQEPILHSNNYDLTVIPEEFDVRNKTPQA